MFLQKLTKLNFDITTVALKLFWPFVLCFCCRKAAQEDLGLFLITFRHSSWSKSFPRQKRRIFCSPLFSVIRRTRPCVDCPSRTRCCCVWANQPGVLPDLEMEIKSWWVCFQWWKADGEGVKVIEHACPPLILIHEEVRAWPEFAFALCLEWNPPSGSEKHNCYILAIFLLFYMDLWDAWGLPRLK